MPLHRHPILAPLTALLFVSVSGTGRAAPRDTTSNPPRRPPTKKTAHPKAQAPRKPEAKPRQKTTPAKSRRKGLRGVRFVRGPDGHTWMRMAVNVRQRFSFMPGLGYAFGLGNQRHNPLNHLLVQAGVGATLYGRWNVYTSRTRMGRITGHGAYAHLVTELSIPLSREAVSTHLAFGLRLQQVFAFGRHALMFVTSVGPRWDLLPMKVGLQATLGVGYTLILPPAGIPILVEAIHQSYDAYEGGTWGLRVSMAWPLTW